MRSPPTNPTLFCAAPQPVRYCQRRIVGDFRKASQQKVSAEEHQQRLKSGRDALELIRRQNIIYGMYTTEFKNLLDKH